MTGAGRSSGAERSSRRSGSGDDTGPLNPLQRLIRDRLASRGWSYGVVARNGGLPRSTVYHLASTRELHRPPRPETLEALARGLELPVTVVRSAAATAAGLHYDAVSVDQETAVLIASLQELTPEDRRHVAALVESMRRRHGASDPEAT